MFRQPAITASRDGKTFQYIAPADGVYTFGMGQINDSDAQLNSQLLIDNLRVNGQVTESFESGAFTGWNVLGTANIATDHDSISPVDGTHLAVLDSQPATQSSLETFLGLQAGQLANIGRASGTSHMPVVIPISLTISANSGDEEIFVTIEGAPPGAVFNYGAVDASTGSWKIMAADVASGVTLLTPEGYTGNFSLSITATAIEPENGSSATTAAQLLPVVILPATTVFRGDMSGTVTEDSGADNAVGGTSPVNGHILAFHLNIAEAFNAASGETAHGSYSINAAGDWVYTLNQHDPNVEALNINDTLADSFSITAADGVQKTIGITIRGANDLPVAIPDGFSSAVDHGLFGELDVIANDKKDPDHGAANKISLGAFPIGSITGPEGVTLLASDFQLGVDEATNKLTLTIGDSFRHLALGETAQVTFNYYLTGNAGDVSTGSVTFDVAGSNEAPVVDASPALSAVTGEITSNSGAANLSAHGTISFTDLDANDTHANGTLTGIEDFVHRNPAETFHAVKGIYGTLTLGAVLEPGPNTEGQVGWTYLANQSALAGLYEGHSVSETFTVVVGDNNGAAATQDVVITLHGSGAPVGFSSVATTATTIGIVDNAGPGGTYTVDGEVDFAGNSTPQAAI